MRSLILKTIIVLFVLPASLLSQSTPDWRWVHPRPQGQYINWFKMLDASTWYAAGDYGIFLKTSNAGANWTTTTGGYPSTLYPGAMIYQNIRCAYFLNASTGFLGYQAVAGIVKTTNAGLTLDTVKILPTGSGTVYGFSFINSNTGYLCGTSTYKVMKTTDAGITWAQVPNLGVLTFYSVYASDSNNIITSSSSGNTYITTNAGVNWTTSNVGTTSTLYQLNFINAQTGYVCGTAGCFRYTTNGGLNWAGTSAPTTSTLYTVIVSGSEIFVSGLVSGENMFKTTDNGSTWTTINYTVPGQLTSMNAYFADKNASTIVVAGTYGQIRKSTNNGANWTEVSYAKSIANLTDIYAQSNNGRVIAVGVDNGFPDVILYSSNGGIDWNSSNYVATDYINNIDMLNANTGFICGRWGRFAKTTSGGALWDTSLTSNPALSPYFCNGLDFINETTGWIVGGVPGIGGNTKIWNTTNGGANWTEQISAYSGPVGVKIQMINASTGYLTCAGALQKTTNGGVNWTLLPNPGPSGISYTPLKVVDANNVFTGGSNSQVYSTSNGGSTWDSLNFPVKAGTIFCTDWYDANNGAAGAVIGVMGKTTNRGASWQIMNMGGYTVMSIKMVHPDTMFAVAGNTFGAQVFKYSRSLVGGFFWENRVPSEYKLEQNYPNPFNPVTKIKFAIPRDGNVSLKVFDITGRQVAVLVNGLNLRAGTMSYDFDGSEIASGIYFYTLIVDNNVIGTRKMVLVK